MNRFEACLSFVLSPNVEGGYGNDRDDRGGATNQGVTQATYDAYRHDCGLPLQSVAGVTALEVRDIYFSRYWLPVRSNVLPAPLDLVVFDTAVNMGVDRARRYLQRAVGVVVDGNIGPITLRAIRSDHAAGYTLQNCEDIVALRDAKYESIARDDPSQRKFLKGWKNRLALLQKEMKKC